MTTRPTAPNTAAMVSKVTLDPELFLAEPGPREIHYTIVSVDDHLVEPPHMFEGRLPGRLLAAAPRIIEDSAGHEVWQFEGKTFTQVGMNAVAGRRPETVRVEPFRLEQMRPGCYDVDARMADMDVNGVRASLNFPSQITGFCGRVFFSAGDRELGAACIRAWNDWFFDEWYSAYPDRIIPLGIAFLADPRSSADEIHRNAERGFGIHAGPAYAALAILAAVLRARATGKGCHLELGQSDAAAYFDWYRIETWRSSERPTDEVYGNASDGGERRPPGTGGMKEGVRYQVYDSADGQILFMASEQEFWRDFCAAVGRMDLFERWPGRQYGDHARGKEERRNELAAIFSGRTTSEWIELGRSNNTPIAPRAHPPVGHRRSPGRRPLSLDPMQL